MFLLRKDNSDIKDLLLFEYYQLIVYYWLYNWHNAYV